MTTPSDVLLYAVKEAMLRASLKPTPPNAMNQQPRPMKPKLKLPALNAMNRKLGKSAADVPPGADAFDWDNVFGTLREMGHGAASFAKASPVTTFGPAAILTALKARGGAQAARAANRSPLGGAALGAAGYLGGGAVGGMGGLALGGGLGAGAGYGLGRALKLDPALARTLTVLSAGTGAGIGLGRGGMAGADWLSGKLLSRYQPTLWNRLRAGVQGLRDTHPEDLLTTARGKADAFLKRLRV